MSPIELAAVVLIGFIGLCSTCLLLLSLGAFILRRDREEQAFRQELTHAQTAERDWEWPMPQRLAPLCTGRSHTHLLDVNALPARRGDR